MQRNREKRGSKTKRRTSPQLAKTVPNNYFNPTNNTSSSYIGTYWSSKPKNIRGNWNKYIAPPELEQHLLECLRKTLPVISDNLRVHIAIKRNSEGKEFIKIIFAKRWNQNQRWERTPYIYHIHSRTLSIETETEFEIADQDWVGDWVHFYGHRPKKRENIHQELVGLNKEDLQKYIDSIPQINQNLKDI